MNTIALRFAENFAPIEGTIGAHQKLIDKNGFVWYEKLESAISDSVAKAIMLNIEPKILLIQSGKFKRYWAFISEITRDIPDPEYIPLYYRNEASKFRSWFKVIRLEEANSNIMSRCIVTSSNNSLTQVSKYSLSPYFKITVLENEI